MHRMHALHIFIIISIFISLPAHEEQKVEVAIVGAGLSGLTAAKELMEAGITKLAVYEAKPFPGGRILSVKLRGPNAHESIVELGGENFFDGGKADDSLSLIRDLDLPVVRKNAPHVIKYFDGHIHEVEDALKVYQWSPAMLRKRLEECALTATSMADVLDNLFATNKTLHDVFSYMLAAYEGADTSLLAPSYTSSLYYLIIGGPSASCYYDGEGRGFLSVEGGNGLIIQKLAERLGSRLHLNMILEKIDRQKDGSFKLTFQGGKIVIAEQLLLTVPCTVYNSIQFDSTVLSEERVKKIQAVTYGTNAKILVSVAPLTTQTPCWCVSKSVGILFEKDTHVATLYYVHQDGDFDREALAKLFKRDLPLVQAGYALAAPFESPTHAEYEPYRSYTGAVGYSWKRDPFVRASYTCSGVSNENDFTEIEYMPRYKVKTKTLFKPHNRFYIAGEHASIKLDIMGTMEAAIESGMRMAKCILKDRDRHDKVQAEAIQKEPVLA